MSTSGTYSFGSPQSEEIITDAYERIGIIATALSRQQIESAQRSLNFILQNWVNKRNNLWTIRQGLLGLTNNQSSYSLPPNAIDVKTVTIRTSTRNLGGTAFSSGGGSASLAFDNNPTTACVQTAPNGYISYSWGNVQYPIAMVGIQPNISTTWTLVGEYSNDNVNWTTALSLPSQNYTQSQLYWFAVPIPVPANLFRVRVTESSVETWSMILAPSWNQFTNVTWKTWGTGTPLNVQELYFNNNLYDTILTRLSESEYTAIPNKSTVGRPTSFWVDRQINPVIRLWLTPNSVYNCLYFTYWEALQDIGTMLNNAEVPARFLEPITAELAYKVGQKESVKNPAIAAMISQLKADSEQAYKEAAGEDRERVPLRIYGDYMQGWSTV